MASLDRVPLIVGVFRTRGATALVFRGDDGLDELTTTGHSHVWEVSRDSSRNTTSILAISGIARARIEDLVGGSPEHNADVVRRTLAGEPGAVRDIVLLNAAAGIVSYRLAEDPSRGQQDFRRSLPRGDADRRRAVDSGAATRTLDAWVGATASSSN